MLFVTSHIVLTVLGASGGPVGGEQLQICNTSRIADTHAKKERGCPALGPYTHPQQRTHVLCSVAEV